MSFDYSKLEGKIKEVFGSQKAFACAMDKSERTISLKLTGKIEWKQGEITQACYLLGIPFIEIVAYFFCRKSSTIELGEGA